MHYFPYLCDNSIINTIIDMKFKYTLILLGAVLFTLTACSSSKEDDPKEDPFVKTMWESSSYIGKYPNGEQYHFQTWIYFEEDKHITLRIEEELIREEGEGKRHTTKVLSLPYTRKGMVATVHVAREITPGGIGPEREPFKPDTFTYTLDASKQRLTRKSTQPEKSPSSPRRSKALAYLTLHTVRPAPSREMRLGGLLFDGLEARRVERKKQHIES